jgi:hypothetical protein
MFFISGTAGQDGLQEPSVVPGFWPDRVVIGIEVDVMLRAEPHHLAEAARRMSALPARINAVAV